MMKLLELLQLVLWIWTGLTVAEQPHQKGTVLFLARWITQIYDPNGIITCEDHWWENDLGGKYMSDGTLTYVPTTGELLWCGGSQDRGSWDWKNYDSQCLILDNNKFVPHSRLIQMHPHDHHTAVINGKVWLFGGDFDIHFKEGHLIESLEGSKWSVEDAPKTPLEHLKDACSVFTGEALFLIGGSTKGWGGRHGQYRQSGNVSKLIPGSRKWESLTPLPAPREKHGCVYLSPNDKFPEGSILVAGGTDGKDCKKCFSDSLLYDISQDSWIPAGEVGHSHAQGYLVDIDGRIVFAGGHDVCNGTLTNPGLGHFCSNIQRTDKVHEFHLENLGTQKATWTELNHNLRMMAAGDAYAVIPIEYWNNGKSCKIPNALPTPPPPPAQGISEETCLSLPNYPNNYPNNLRTTNKFSVPAGEDIEITLIDVDTEKRGGRCKDFVRFYDGNGKAVIIRAFLPLWQGTDMCGAYTIGPGGNLPKKFVIPTSSASVYFYSDGTGSKKGFKFCYKPAKLWRDDGRCGFHTIAPNIYGTRGQCDPLSTENGKGPCCSSSGFCGPFAVHCDCPSCVNYKKGHTGCNGADVQIPCCPEMTSGDNSGDLYGGKEIFLQENEIIESTCQANCQRLYPESVGISESTVQSYSNGQPKCWCEFGVPKRNHNNYNYQTCLFKP